jgi:hypothetical protein
VRFGYVLFPWEGSGDFSDKDWGIGAGGDSEGLGRDREWEWG